MLPPDGRSCNKAIRDRNGYNVDGCCLRVQVYRDRRRGRHRHRSSCHRRSPYVAGFLCRCFAGSNSYRSPRGGLTMAASSVDTGTAMRTTAAAHRQGGPAQPPVSLCPLTVHTVAHTARSIMAAVPNVPTTVAARQFERWRRHPPALKQVHSKQVSGCHVSGRSCSLGRHLHACMAACQSVTTSLDGM